MANYILMHVIKDLPETTHQENTPANATTVNIGGKPRCRISSGHPWKRSEIHGAHSLIRPVKEEVIDLASGGQIRRIRSDYMGYQTEVETDSQGRVVRTSHAHFTPKNPVKEYLKMQANDPYGLRTLRHVLGLAQ